MRSALFRMTVFLAVAASLASALGHETSAQSEQDETNCTSSCPPTEDSQLLYCDVTMLSDWPESVLLDEIRAKLSSRGDENCVLPDDATLYVQPPDAENNDRVVSLTNAALQFYGLTVDIEDVTPTGYSECITQVATPTSPRSLNEELGALPEVEKVPEVASDLIRFVFIPRIVRFETDVRSPRDGERFAFAIAPVSAVPAVLFDQGYATPGELAIELQLAAYQKQLEPQASFLIRIMQRQFASWESGAKRLDERRWKRAVALGAGGGEAGPRKPPGLVYTAKEIAYLNREFGRTLERHFLAPEPAERSSSEGRERIIPNYLERFQRFWRAVDKAKAIFEARSVPIETERTQ